MNLTKESELHEKQIVEIDEMKPWLHGPVPAGYWTIERNRRMALTWLFEIQLQWKDEDIKLKTKKKIFSENKLLGLLKTQFQSSPYKAVEFYTNKRIKPWEMKITPMSFFDSEENQIEAIKWLFEEKLKWNEDDFKTKLKRNIFEKHGLGAILSHYDNYFEVIELAYPKRFLPWEIFIAVPNGYWETKENRIEALQWLFDKKLKWNEEEIIEHINTEVFRKSEIDGLFQYYDCSPYKVIRELYGDKYKPWELQRVTRDFWNDEKNCKEALHWLVYEKCKEEEISEHHFIKHGLITLLVTKYKNDVTCALNSI